MNNYGKRRLSMKLKTFGAISLVGLILGSIAFAANEISPPAGTYSTSNGTITSSTEEGTGLKTCDVADENVAANGTYDEAEVQGTEVGETTICFLKMNGSNPSNPRDSNPGPPPTTCVGQYMLVFYQGYLGPPEEPGMVPARYYVYFRCLLQDHMDPPCFYQNWQVVSAGSSVNSNGDDELNWTSEGD